MVVNYVTRKCELTDSNSQVLGCITVARHFHCWALTLDVVHADSVVTVPSGQYMSVVAKCIINDIINKYYRRNRCSQKWPLIESNRRFKKKMPHTILVEPISLFSHFTFLFSITNPHFNNSLTDNTYLFFVWQCTFCPSSKCHSPNLFHH